MRPLAVLAMLAAVAPPLAAQAPASAGLWRVAAVSLATPPALGYGVAAQFWNPAAPHAGTLAAGIEVVQTSDVLGLSGIIAGASQRLGPVDVGLLMGRMEVHDLVRTTTSPSSEPDGIPVYAQLAGVRLGWTWRTLTVAGLARVHDTRFDRSHEGGATLDAGVTFAPGARLRLAGATHFLPGGGTELTEYYGGAEYRLADDARLAGARTRVVGRYGLTAAGGGLEHAVGTGFTFDDHFRVDIGLTREVGYGHAAWRPALGLSLAVGRYTVVAGRAAGVGEVGATYRVGLDIELTR